MEQQRHLYRVDIFETDVVLTDFTQENGIAQKFLITPEQLGGFFNQGSVFKPEPGLVWEWRENNSRKVLFEYPARKEAVNIYVATPDKAKGKRSKLRRYRMLLPAMVVQATIQIGARGDETVEMIRMWCMNTNRITPQTRLYDPPLPNFSGASMCLGNVKRTVKGSTRDSLWNVIFETVFNHHHGHVAKEGLSIADFARKYQGKRIPLTALNKSYHGAKSVLDPGTTIAGRG